MDRNRARAKYWDERIVAWEAARYDGRLSWALGPADWAAGLRPGPTRLRQRLGVDLAVPFLAGRAVVEAGCGTGLLAQRFLDAGARSYLGLDVSGAAIAAARQRHAAARVDGRLLFQIGASTEVAPGAGLVVSLGMLDWLTDAEIGRFFFRHGDADFIHTFSERRRGPRQFAQRCARAVAAAARPEGVRPRFMSLDELVRLIPARRGPLYTFRDPGLRDAVFVTSLPVRGAAVIGR